MCHGGEPMFGWLPGLGAWLYANVLGNEVASLLAWIAVSVTAWFWKIRPHFRAQQAHREHFARWAAAHPPDKGGRP